MQNGAFSAGSSLIISKVLISIEHQRALQNCKNGFKYIPGLKYILQHYEK
jgi:hypothetical protein